MKKLLFLSLLFINLHAYSQAKVEAVIGASETTSSPVISGSNQRTSGYGDGVYGFTRTTNGSGVQGRTYGLGAGVYGYSENNAGIGVHGFSESGIGVQGVGYFNNSIAGRFEHQGAGKALITIGGLRFGGNNVGTVTTGKFMKSVSAAGDAEWSELVPYYHIGNFDTYMLGLENDSETSAVSTIYGRNNVSGSSTSGVVGVASYENPTANPSGVKGLSYATNDKGYGVYGEHYGTGIGIYGFANMGTGVSGYSAAKYGVYGKADGQFGIGVNGRSQFGQGVFGSTDSGVSIYGIATSGTGAYFTSSTGYALITNFGKVGVGVLEPNNQLDVNGRIRVRHTTNTAGIWMSNSANSVSDADGAFYGMKTNTETGIYIGNNWRFWVTSAGNATLTGTLTQSSDKRLKKDFSSLNNSLSGLYQLNGYHYKWIEESRSKDLQTGLIAQEVQKIFPELVQTDEAGFLAVNYTGLVPHLIEAVKELRNENNALKGKNQTLESRLDKIEALLTAQQQYIGKMASK